MATGSSRQRSRYTNAILISLLLLAGSIFTGIGGQQSQVAAAHTALAQQFLTKLQDGDLVFRTGRDLLARVVLSQGDSPRFSHVGVIVRRAGVVLVVHAVPAENGSPGGVVEETLAAFADAEKTADIGFFRATGLDDQARQRIASYARRQLGKPFDDELRFSDDARFYCTELAIKSLLAGGRLSLPMVESVNVITIQEPVFPPDALRRLAQLSAIQK